LEFTGQLRECEEEVSICLFYLALLGMKKKVSAPEKKDVYGWSLVVIGGHWWIVSIHVISI